MWNADGSLWMTTASYYPCSTTAAMLILSIGQREERGNTQDTTKLFRRTKRCRHLINEKTNKLDFCSFFCQSIDFTCWASHGFLLWLQSTSWIIKHWFSMPGLLAWRQKRIYLVMQGGFQRDRSQLCILYERSFYKRRPLLVKPGVGRGVLCIKIYVSRSCSH